MRNSFGYSLRKKMYASILFSMVVAIACTKTEEEPLPVIPPPVNPPASAPTGIIQTFTLNDSLVAFNTGTVIKWLVNGTNSATVVKLNGVKIANYGSMETGPIKTTTLFTLEVNSGPQAVLILRNADSITSLLWSKGKSARLIKKEVFIDPILPDSANKWGWRDTSQTISAILRDQRVFFGLNNYVTTIQGTSNINVSAGNAGKFVTDPSGLYIWQGILYTIQSADGINLVVTYDAAQTIGPKLKTRNTYLIE